MTATSVADQAFNRFVVSIACAVYLVGYAGYSFESLGSLRYLVYAVPLILVASLTLQRTPTSNKAAMARASLADQGLADCASGIPIRTYRFRGLWPRPATSADACIAGPANFTITTDGNNLFGGNVYRVPAASGPRSRNARARRRGAKPDYSIVALTNWRRPQYRQARSAEARR
jgi:hypothetical protein